MMDKEESTDFPLSFKSWGQLILDNLEREYQFTNNSLFVWRALQHCNQFKLNIPAWVQTYLFESAENLMEEILQRKNDITSNTPSKIRADRIVYDSLNFNRDAFNTYCKSLQKVEVCRIVMHLESLEPKEYWEEAERVTEEKKRNLIFEHYNILPLRKWTKEEIYLAVENITGVNQKTVEAWYREKDNKPIGRGTTT